MQLIMFTKYLKELDIPALINAMISADVEGADLCVRPGYPVNPENVQEALPRAAKQFAEAGLSIPLVTAPTNLNRPDIDYVVPLYTACAEAGVANIKVGYWPWSPGDDYWQRVKAVRADLEGFAKLSQDYGVRTCIHNHSGTNMGLNSCSAMDLVEDFDPAEIGIFADPGHLSIVGEPIDMALDIVKEYLAIVCFKDLMWQRTMQKNNVTWRTRVVRLGEGLGDWETLLATLKSIDFSGPVSFHSEYRDVPMETVIDLTRIDVRFIQSKLASL